MWRFKIIPYSFPVPIKKIILILNSFIWFLIMVRRFTPYSTEETNYNEMLFALLFSGRTMLIYLHVVYYMYTYAKTEHRRRQANTQYRQILLLQIRTVYLIPDFGSWWHEERDTILKSRCWPYDADPTNARRIPWCLRSLSVEIRKSQLHLSTVKIQLSSQ